MVKPIYRLFLRCRHAFADIPRLVVSLYSKIMLDIMGVFALGVELGNLQPADNAADNSFDECYHEIFDPDSWGQILMGLNAIFPVRWLPLEANRRFKQALHTVRSQLMAIIRDRIRTVGEWKAAGIDSDAYRGKDLLTFMVAEKYYADSDRWTPEYIMEQVGGPCLTTATGNLEADAASHFSLDPDVSCRR